jgi:murein DD-endopeptidase MepM/ murein hydrolase activator NlpD
MTATAFPSFRRWPTAGLAVIAFTLFTLTTRAEVRPLALVLPTKNRALLNGNPAQFYQYCDRTFEGRVTQPWQAGQYGYVRNPLRTSSGIVYTRFHEGLDIKPVERDRKGEPLDIVRAISEGTVAYVCPLAGRSNYGKYIVIEHDWGYGKFYSLYAHLAKVTTAVGEKVAPGAPIAVMGYTGSGLDRTRAHVHLELNMIIQSRFSKWHDQSFNTPNYHGAFNGLNLTGIDIAGLYAAHARNPKITIPQFLASTEPYFKVTVPRNGSIEAMDNYPWLARNMGLARGRPSWEIQFDSAGVPLAVSPSKTSVAAPTVSWVRTSNVSHRYNTRGLLSGSGRTATLSGEGLGYIRLITGQF